MVIECSNFYRQLCMVRICWLFLLCILTYSSPDTFPVFLMCPFLLRVEDIWSPGPYFWDLNNMIHICSPFYIFRPVGVPFLVFFWAGARIVFDFLQLRIAGGWYFFNWLFEILDVADLCERFCHPMNLVVIDNKSLPALRNFSRISWLFGLLLNL